MKKFIVVLVLLFAATVVFGQALQIPRSVQGAKWLDPNFDAIWEFSTDSIKILDSKTGELYYTLNSGVTQNFKATISGATPAINFDCADTGRNYTFAIDASTDIIMTIRRDGLADYKVTMKKQ